MSEPCPCCGKLKNGGKLRIRTSRNLDKLREAHRECTAGYGYADVAMVKPAEVISARVLYPQQSFAPI